MGGTFRRRIIVTSEFKAGVTGTKQVDALAKAQDGVTKANKKAVSTFGTVRSSLTRLRIVYFNLAVLLGTVALVTRALIKPSIELETQMANVRKTTNLTSEEIAELRSDFIELAKSVPQSAKELAEIGAVAGQLGIRGTENILNFTKTVALMATATELTAEEAAKALGKISNAFNLPISQANNLGSVINELSNTTAANSTEIVSALTRIGAAGANLGITVDFASALGATLIGAGFRAQRAGTRIRSALTRIISNMDGIRKALPNLDIKEFAELLEEDANEAILLLLKSFKELGETTEAQAKIMEVFGKVGGFAIQTLVGNLEEFEINLATANREFEIGLSLLKETAIQLNTTANQWALLSHEIQSLILNNEGPLKRFLKTTRELLIAREITGGGVGVIESLILKGPILETGLEGIKEKLREAYGEENFKRIEKIINAQEDLLGQYDVASRALDLINSEYRALTDELDISLDKLKEENEVLAKGSEEWEKAKSAIEDAKKEYILTGRITEDTRKNLDDLNLTVMEATEIQKDAGIETVDFKQKQDDFNNSLKILQETYALGNITLSEYKQEVIDLKDEYPELTKLTEVQSLAINKLGQEAKSAGGYLGDLISKFGIKKADIKYAKLIAYKEEQAGVVSGGAYTGINPVTGRPWGGSGLGDFIARPGEPIQTFSPDDTIIGTKDPSSIINNKKVGPITINVNGAQSPFNTASEISRQIKSLA